LTCKGIPFAGVSPRPRDRNTLRSSELPTHRAGAARVPPDERRRPSVGRPKIGFNFLMLGRRVARCKMGIFDYHGSEEDSRSQSRMTKKYQLHTFVVQPAILLKATIRVSPAFSLRSSCCMACATRTIGADFRVPGLLADGGHWKSSGRFLPW